MGDIWEYTVTDSVLPRAEVVSECMYCRYGTIEVDEEHKETIFGAFPQVHHVDLGRQVHRAVELRTCARCGWWVLSYRTVTIGNSSVTSDAKTVIRRATASLRRLDLSDISVPTKVLRQYLVAKYDERYSLHPRAYEDIVAQVFADFGYSVRLTSYSKDGGIDLFILDGDQDTVGVQVKRYSRRITVSQIREFAGALMYAGLTEGIYVTTSGFTRDAKDAAADFGTKAGVAIHLIGAADFYQGLGLTTRPLYTRLEDTGAPYFLLLPRLDDLPIAHEHYWISNR